MPDYWVRMSRGNEENEKDEIQSRANTLKGGVRVCNFEKIDFFCLIL